MTRTQLTTTIHAQRPDETGFYLQHGDDFSRQDFCTWVRYLPSIHDAITIDAQVAELAPGQWLSVEYTPDEAHRIADSLRGRWRDDDDRGIDELVAATWSIPPEPDVWEDMVRYECRDGSAIVVSAVGYDVEGPVPFSWAGVGVTVAQLTRHIHHLDSEQAPGSETRLLAKYMAFIADKGDGLGDMHTIVPDGDVRWWLGAYAVQAELAAAHADGLIDAGQVADALDRLQDAADAPQVRFVVSNCYETLGDPASATACTAAEARRTFDDYVEDAVRMIMGMPVGCSGPSGTMEEHMWDLAGIAADGNDTYTEDAARLIVKHAVCIDVDVM